MDVFLLPSLYEGLPIVAVEAQAANVKMVMSTEVSEDTVLSENVRFVPLDADLDRWEAEVMGEPKGNSPKPEMEAFDMRKTAKALEKIYDAKEASA
jgi:glycosyltransferase involved in cell wall biosynthesis